MLRAVTVCDGYEADGRHWQCEDSSVLPGLVDLLRRTAPTASVIADVTGSIVRVDRKDYPNDPNNPNDESGDLLWWAAMAKGVSEVYGLWDSAAEGLTGSKRYYFGVVSERAPGTIGGMAALPTDDGPGHGAGGRASHLSLGVETNKEVVAHETAHLMGRKHTNTEAPAGGTVPPGCYNLALDAATDWPFADNTIQSANGPEVAFDVAANKPLQPESTFELMSYCTPRWMSPFTYRHVLDALGGAAPPAAASRIKTAGAFWTVGGYIAGGTATIDPIFTRVMDASTDAGSGTYSIVVQNAQGAALFTRHFTPAQPSTETPGPDVKGPPVYFELIPVQAGAARIAVLDPASAEIASRMLGGVAPTVAFVAPAEGAILQGQQDVQWAIDDADSVSWSSALEYSPDGGANWIVLGSTTTSELAVDFDKLPGSKGNAQLRVFVSDGANTGSAVSAPFAVASHLPSVAIIANDRSHYRLGDVVWLRADAYDRDDGVLDGASVQWTSNRAGALGQGASLPVYSLPPGGHTITVTATDADGNSASASEAITVAGAGPSVVLTTRNLNAAVPRTCVEVAVDAFSGSSDVPLSAVRYSLDGGLTFTDLDPAHLPFSLVVPGSGLFHVVAHAFDAAGQWDVKDVQLYTAAPCVMTNHPPLANAGPDRTVAAGNAPTLVVLDGSHSSDSDSTPGTQDDIVEFLWFENPFLPNETFLGLGAQLQVQLTVGVHHLLLQVKDKANLYGQAPVTITVQPGPVSSSTTLGTSVNPSVSGQSVTLTATVAGSTPTGTVTFMDGAATLCNAVALTGGEAPCATSTLAVGSRSLTAIYSGDAGNTGSTSGALPQVVNKAGTSTVLGAHAPNPSAVGTPIAVTATVAVLAPGAGVPTGIITVGDGSVNCSITLPATGCDLAPISAGAKTLVAVYSGDMHFNGSASPVVAHIVDAITATLDLDASITATKYDAFTDGLLVMRYLFGLSGTSLTAGALGATATRTDPSAIKAHLDGMRSALDVDANGTADALTDGLLIVRYLFGLRGDALIGGAVDPLGARNTATAIEDYLQTLMP